MRVVLGLALVAPAAALVNNGGVTPNHQPSGGTRSGGTRGLVLPRHVAATAEVAAPVTVDACGVALDGQELERRLRATSFLYPEKVEVIKDLEPFVETQIEDRLLTAETAWQPMGEQLSARRARARSLSYAFGDAMGRARHLTLARDARAFSRRLCARLFEGELGGGPEGFPAPVRGYHGRDARRAHR